MLPLGSCTVGEQDRFFWIDSLVDLFLGIYFSDTFLFRLKKTHSNLMYNLFFCYLCGSFVNFDLHVPDISMIVVNSSIDGTLETPERVYFDRETNLKFSTPNEWLVLRHATNASTEENANAP